MSILKTFSAVGETKELLIKAGGTLFYKIDLSSDWDGTVVLRRTNDGGSTYEPVETFTALASESDGDTIENVEGNYSFSCIDFTAGTAIVTLTDMSDGIVAPLEAGLPSGVNIVATEKGDGVVNKTILKLASVPLSVVSVTTGNGVGGAKVYDFPEGRILMLGCMADLTLAIAAADQADYTDATPEGDVAIGSVAPADADGLGTDATDDDMATSVAFTMAAYTASSQVPSEPSLQFDGTSTALDMYVNALVDAADIDDDTTTTVLVSGIIECTWINLGNF